MSVWLDWSYLIFWLPLLTAVLLVLTSTVGHGHHARHRSSVRHSISHRAARVSNVRHDGLVSAASGVFDFLGFQRAPAVLVLSSMLMGWGLCGLLTVELLNTPWGALAAAGVGSILASRTLSGLMMRLTPQDESYALRLHDLVGLKARVVYPVSATSGRVHVYDAHHTLHVKVARASSGPYPVNAEVTVIAVDESTGSLIVHSLQQEGVYST